jgi:hypothetical protein
MQKRRKSDTINLPVATMVLVVIHHISDKTFEEFETSIIREIWRLQPQMPLTNQSCFVTVF